MEAQTIQQLKEGKGELEQVAQMTLRDPIRQQLLLDTTSVAGGNVTLSSGTLNFGPRGAGILGIVVGQTNGGTSDLPAWTATIKVYDMDGLQIGTDITQTIPLTPSGKSVWTQLNVAQQVALRAQRMTISGTLVANANTTVLKAYFTEQAPGINVSFDAGDNVAQETNGNLATLATNVPAKGQALAAASLPVVLPALQEASLKAVTEASAAAIKTAVETLAAAANLAGLRVVDEPDIGMGVYSTTKGDFTAAINNGAKTATITWSTTKPEVNPIPFTLTAKNVRRAQLVESDGTRTELPCTGITVSSLTITFTNAPANFATGQTIDIWLQGPDKSVRDWYLYDSGVITVAEGGSSATVDLSGLVDGRNFRTIEFLMCAVDGEDFQYASAGDNNIQLLGKSVRLAGNDNAYITQFRQNAAGRNLKGKISRDNWGTTSVAGVAMSGATFVETNASMYGMFKDIQLVYTFKGKGVGSGTYPVRFFVKFSN